MNDFKEFLERNEVDFEEHFSNKKIEKRYVRIKPTLLLQKGEKEVEEFLKEELESEEVKRVEWLPFVYEIPSQIKLSMKRVYIEGLVYGIDIASAAVIYYGLDPQLGEHILDLCCAPGPKLCFIGDLLHFKSELKKRMEKEIKEIKEGGLNEMNELNETNELNGVNGLNGLRGVDYYSVSGVDVNEKRLSTCKALVKKYKVKQVRLFLGDATLFQIFAPFHASNEKEAYLIAQTNSQNYEKLKKQESSEESKAEKREGEKKTEKNLKKRKGIGKEFNKKNESEKNEKNESNKNEKNENRESKRKKKYRMDSKQLYFCNSFAIRSESVEKRKYDKVLVDAPCTSDGAVRHILKHNKYRRDWSEEKSLELVELQKKLLEKALKMVKEGGQVVYCTCSFTVSQNEAVLSHILHLFGESVSLVPFLNHSSIPAREGSLKHTLRFYGLSSFLFAAKIKKLSQF